MRIVGIETLTVGLALRTPVRSAGVTHADRTALLLRVATDEGSGWGECTASPDARPPDPTVSDVEPAVVDRLAGRLFAACHRGVLVPAAEVTRVLDPVTVAEQAVAAALEMAVLDVELTSVGRSLAALVGATSSVVPTGSVVGVTPGHDEGKLVEEVAAALAAGARRLRLKIEPGWDHRPLQVVRDRHPTLAVLADANGSFDPASSDALMGLDDYHLIALEQPFAADNLESHRALSESMSTPIGLDESLWSRARVDQALAAGACRVACLKPGRLGGAFATIAAAASCRSADVRCFVGGFFETGLGRAVNAALAGRSEFDLPGDLGDPDVYLIDNPFGYLEVHDGYVALSASPGLGATVRSEVLRSHTLGARWLAYGS